mgnify:FL=1
MGGVRQGHRLDAVSHVPAPTPNLPDARARRRGRVRAWAVLGSVLAAVIGALASSRVWTRMSMTRGRMRGMDPGPTSQVAANGPLVVGVLLALAGLLGVAVWLAWRSPRAAYGVALVAATAYLYLAGPLPSTIPALAITLAMVMRARPANEWLGWAALLLPVFAAAALAYEDADPLSLVAFVLGVAVAWVVAPALVIQLVVSRRASVAAARDDELRRVAYEERLRVARDIHDVVGHSLSMISLQSGVALHVLESDPAQVRASLEAIRESSRSSLAELRQTLGVFRKPDEGGPLVPTATLADVPALVESVRAGGREVGLLLAADASRGVPAAVQTVAYRVVQEGLTNVVRHAAGASAVVSIERRPEVLVVGVRDDGPARQAPVEGNGLRGMRERVEAVGGTLGIGVRPEGGLAVLATLPIGGPQ